MSGQIMFEADGLDGLSMALDDGVQGLHDILQTLEHASAALAGGWSGDAQRAYDRAHSEWATSMAQLNAVAAEAGRIARVASQRYDTVERANANRWNA